MDKDLERAEELARERAGDFLIHGRDEVNMTALAEDIAHELDHDEWLDDPDHDIWGIALEAADEWETQLHHARTWEAQFRRSIR